MRFAHMDRLPVILAGHRVKVALAQVPYVVRLEKLLDRVRVSAELLVVKPNSPLVLQTALYRLYLAIPLDRSRDARRGHSKRKQDQCHQEDYGDQHVAVLVRRRYPRPGIGLHASWRKYGHTAA